MRSIRTLEVGGDFKLHMSLPNWFNRSFPSPPSYPHGNTLKRPVTQASDTPLGAPPLHPLAHAFVSSAGCQFLNCISLIFMAPEAHSGQAQIPHSTCRWQREPGDKGCWEGCSECHLPHWGSHRNWQPRGLQWPHQAGSWSTRGRTRWQFSPLWKFPITEMVSGDNILKAIKYRNIYNGGLSGFQKQAHTAQPKRVRHFIQLITRKQ